MLFLWVAVFIYFVVWKKLVEYWRWLYMQGIARNATKSTVSGGDKRAGLNHLVFRYLSSWFWSCWWFCCHCWTMRIGRHRRLSRWITDNCGHVKTRASMYSAYTPQILTTIGKNVFVSSIDTLKMINPDPSCYDNFCKWSPSLYVMLSDTGSLWWSQCRTGWVTGTAQLRILRPTLCG